MAKETITRIRKELGDKEYQSLESSCLDDGLLEKVGERLFAYSDRVPGVDVKKTLRVNFIKFAVGSKKLHPAKVTGEAEQLIKAIGYDTSTKEGLYESLFDNNLIRQPGIVVVR